MLCYYYWLMRWQPVNECAGGGGWEGEEWIWACTVAVGRQTEWIAGNGMNGWRFALNCGQQFGSYLSPLSVCKTDKINSDREEAKEPMKEEKQFTSFTCLPACMSILCPGYCYSLFKRRRRSALQWCGSSLSVITRWGPAKRTDRSPRCCLGMYFK